MPAVLVMFFLAFDLLELPTSLGIKRGLRKKVGVLSVGVPVARAILFGVHILIVGNSHIRTQCTELQAIGLGAACPKRRRREVSP